MAIASTLNPGKWERKFSPLKQGAGGGYEVCWCRRENFDTKLVAMRGYLIASHGWQMRDYF